MDRQNRIHREKDRKKKENDMRRAYGFDNFFRGETLFNTEFNNKNNQKISN